MNYVNRNRKMVVILSVLFVAALVHRSGVLSGAADSGSSREKDLASAESAQTEPAQQKVVNLRHYNWPESRLEELLEFSPFGFDLPAEDSSGIEVEPAVSEAVNSAPEAIETESTAATRLRPKAIYQSQHGPVALVGSRIIRVGDVLDDGSRVIAIGDRELILDRVRVEGRNSSDNLPRPAPDLETVPPETVLTE